MFYIGCGMSIKFRYMSFKLRPMLKEVRQGGFMTLHRMKIEDLRIIIYLEKVLYIG